MRSALILFGLEFLSFLIITVNFRAVAKGWIATTVGTDAAIAGLGFTLIKLVGEAQTPLEMIGYVLGACGGSATGMVLTRHWREVGRE